MTGEFRDHCDCSGCLGRWRFVVGTATTTQSYACAEIFSPHDRAWPTLDAVDCYFAGRPTPSLLEAGRMTVSPTLLCRWYDRWDKERIGHACLGSYTAPGPSGVRGPPALRLQVHLLCCCAHRATALLRLVLPTPSTATRGSLAGSMQQQEYVHITAASTKSCIHSLRPGDGLHQRLHRLGARPGRPGGGRGQPTPALPFCCIFLCL